MNIRSELSRNDYAASHTLHGCSSCPPRRGPVSDLVWDHRWHLRSDQRAHLQSRLRLGSADSKWKSTERHKSTIGLKLGHYLPSRVSLKHLVGCCQRLPLAFLVAAEVPAYHHRRRCHPEPSEGSPRRYPC